MRAARRVEKLLRDLEVFIYIYITTKHNVDNVGIGIETKDFVAKKTWFT